MRFLSIFALFIIVLSCSPKAPELKTGVWRGVLTMDAVPLPFTFEVENNGGQYAVFIRNAEEKLKLDEISIDGDSVKMVLHIFDAELHAKVEDNSLKGFFLKNYDPSFKMPFNATYGDDFRYAKPSDEVTVDFSGKYAVNFISDDQKDTTVSVAVFTQKGNHAEGTFLTTTGDYRYLEGSVVDSTLYLSTFDGNHNFVFTAKKKGDALQGDWYSGKKSHESWSGKRDDNAKMPDVESLTYLKEGFDKIEFSFPDLTGAKISPSDPKFKDKVVILQIFGTWCPNCMDETKFLTEWYNANHQRGVEIVGLAYERKPEFDYASARVKKMKDKLNVPYDFVIAGTNNKKLAGETLPMLNRVLAFPTTIFIGKDGKVKHIRTGFEGPGTGAYYEEFKQRFNEIVNEMLSEKMTASK